MAPPDSYIKEGLDGSAGVKTSDGQYRSSMRSNVPELTLSDADSYRSREWEICAARLARSGRS